MPRPKRIAKGGVIYHALNRANGRLRIFKNAATSRRSSRSWPNLKKEVENDKIKIPDPFISPLDYTEDGNVNSSTVNSDPPVGYGYTGDLMTMLGSDPLGWDDNGQLTNGLPEPGGTAVWSYDWNWDGKLRSGSKYIDANRTDEVSFKYDPMGNRVYKSSTVDNVTTIRKYLVDINGSLPVILSEVEADPANQYEGSLTKSYVYAGAQVLAMWAHDVTDPTFFEQYFYVHDRLGNIRLVVKPVYDAQQTPAWSAQPVHSYSYTPFGEFYAPDTYENPAEVANPFKFTGQWYDAEISQYHLRARMYDPTMMRFVSRDPISGNNEEPMTLHKYLYCWNNPSNLVDLTGEEPISIPDMLGSMFINSMLGMAEGAIGGLTFGASSALVRMANGEDFDAAEWILDCAVAGAAMGAVAGGMGGPWVEARLHLKCLRASLH